MKIFPYHSESPFRLKKNLVVEVSRIAKPDKKGHVLGNHSFNSRRGALGPESKLKMFLIWLILNAVW